MELNDKIVLNLVDLSFDEFLDVSTDKDIISIIDAVNSLDLSFDEFLDVSTDKDIISIIDAINSLGLAKVKHNSFLSWKRTPGLIYGYLLREMIMLDETNPRAKKIRMLVKLGEFKNEDLHDGIVYSMVNVNHVPDKLENYSLYKRIEWMTVNDSISDLIDRVRKGSYSGVACVKALWLGLISQLNKDEYTAVDDVYKVKDLDTSIERLLNEINFNMCLVDIYSILFAKEYAGLSGAHEIFIERVINKPITDIKPYDKTKKSYFGKDVK